MWEIGIEFIVIMFSARPWGGNKPRYIRHFEMKISEAMVDMFELILLIRFLFSSLENLINCVGDWNRIYSYNYIN